MGIHCQRWGSCVAIAIAAICGQAYGQAGAGVVPAVLATASDSTPMGDVTLTGCHSCGEYGGYCDSGYGDCGGCDLGACGCDTGCCGCEPCCGRCPGQVFAGVEWLSLRANFSEATAYRVIDFVEGTETLEQFNFNYGDSYRIYAGYRLPDCASEILFTYSRFDSTGGFDSGEFNNVDITFSGPYELAQGGLGDSIIGFADVEVDTYDIAFAKTIPLGGCVATCGCGGCGDECGDCCDPCGGCCDPCGGCCICPAWDLQFIGGIRVANVDSELGFQTLIQTANVGVNPPRSAFSNVNFDGVGLRAGALGRRYFGRSGSVSAYVRGDISLLLGDVETTVTSPGGVFLPVSLTSTEVIPVTEIEAGVTAWLTKCASVTAGYMLSAWHDLGHRPEYDYGATGTQLLSMDDANMMTFDGFFLRAEVAY